MNVEMGVIGAEKSASFGEGHIPHRERARLRLQFALIGTDLIAIGAAMVCASLLRFNELFNAAGWAVFVPLSLIYVAVALHGDAYGTDVLRHPSRGTARALVSLLVSLSAVLLVAFYLQASAEMSRAMLALSTIGAAVLITTFRRMVHRWANRDGAAALWTEIIITDGVECVGLPHLRRYEAEVVGLRPTADDPMMLDRLGRFLRHVDRVVVACIPERRARWTAALKGANVRGEVVAPELSSVGALGIDRCGDAATIIVSTGSLGLRNRLLKRAMDLSMAVLALIVLAPLLAVTACAIRLDSAGPVLFVQPRLGRGNRLFNMFKFRSMRHEASDEKGTQSTLRDDSRITRVGRFIRATSIDELPQLLNILRGDMSFVGPRPHALGSTADERLFWELDERYWLRHAIKPGLTGLAQVRGFRGATHAAADLTDRLQADLEYLTGWTIWRDLSILVQTFKVLVHRNAF